MIFQLPIDIADFVEQKTKNFLADWNQLLNTVKEFISNINIDNYLLSHITHSQGSNC
jgi:hypothetical protein